MNVTVQSKQNELITNVNNFTFSDYNIALDIFDGLLKYKIIINDFKTSSNDNLIFKIKIDENEFESEPINIESNQSQVGNDKTVVVYSKNLEVDETNESNYKFNKLWIYIKK